MTKREHGFERFESACVECAEPIVEFRPKGAMHRAPRRLCADCLAQRFEVKIVKTPPTETVH